MAETVANKPWRPEDPANTTGPQRSLQFRREESLTVTNPQLSRSNSGDIGLPQANNTLVD